MFSFNPFASEDEGDEFGSGPGLGGPNLSADPLLDLAQLMDPEIFMSPDTITPQTGFEFAQETTDQTINNLIDAVALGLFLL